MNNEQLSLQTKAAFDLLCGDSVETTILTKEAQQISYEQARQHAEAINKKQQKRKRKTLPFLPSEHITGYSQEVYLAKLNKEIC